MGLGLRQQAASGGEMSAESVPARPVLHLRRQTRLVLPRQVGDTDDVRDRSGQHVTPEPPLVERTGMSVHQRAPLQRFLLLHLRHHALQLSHQHPVGGVGVGMPFAVQHDTDSHFPGPTFVVLHTSLVRVCAPRMARRPSARLLQPHDGPRRIGSHTG